HILASTIPNCVSYDPTYAYEMAVIVQDGLKRMYEKKEKVFYYITSLNENYSHPAMPGGVAEGIRRGIYRLKKSTVKAKKAAPVERQDSGSMLRQNGKDAAWPEQQDVAADVWSVTSFNELGSDGRVCERTGTLPAAEQQPLPYLARQVQESQGLI